ncbi:MAG: S41 family peptidase [Parachlamydiaceae bacterium]
MRVINQFRLFVSTCFCFIFVFNSCVADSQLLKTEDVNTIMKQIFSQHYDKKEMTASILKKSFNVYVDQFDPDRVYLLESEIHPFFSFTDSQVEQFMSQYQQGKFPEYQQLNDIIQKAIGRARTIRGTLEKENLSPLFLKDNSQQTPTEDEWSDPDLKRPFAKSESQLAQRTKQVLAQFITTEKQRYGGPYVIDRQDQTIRLFERRSKDHENQYLFLNENGSAMSDAEKENAFTMHVLKALASSLDAHTTVLNPAEAYDMRLRLEKEMQGIGIVIQSTRNGYVISQMVKDGPAAKNGEIKEHDRLVSIDGTALQGLSLEKVTEMLQGKQGSKINLVLKRPANDGKEEKVVNVSLVREEIAVNDDRALMQSIPVDGGIIGLIKLDSFYENDKDNVTSENDVRDAIKKLDQKGKLRGLILDLRENSGGFLSQAVKVAGLFITNGVVVVSKYFNGEEHFYRDMDGKLAYDGPLIVLTSKATASAAEIVAQALQDYGVAIIVGDEHTYGKGTIQSQTATDDKASTFFKVTVGKYYTVSGKTPQIQGVKADVVVPSPFAHEMMGEEHLDYPLKPDVIPSSYDDDLSDVTPNLKPWYMRYYAPTVQHKKSFWDNMLPELKKNSQVRISQNKGYQAFLNSKAGAQAVDVEGLQIAEAVFVMKDMIRLQADHRDDETNLRETAAKGNAQTQ